MILAGARLRVGPAFMSGLSRTRLFYSCDKFYSLRKKLALFDTTKDGVVNIKDEEIVRSFKKFISIFSIFQETMKFKFHEAKRKLKKRDFFLKKMHCIKNITKVRI